MGQAVAISRVFWPQGAGPFKGFLGQGKAAGIGEKFAQAAKRWRQLRIDLDRALETLDRPI